MRPLRPATALLLLGFALSALVGCGGTVEGAAGDAPGAEDEEMLDAEDTTAGGTGSAGPREDGNDAGDAGELPLEDCDLGFFPGEGTEPCNWLAEERCYETKAKACDCICPREGPSICSSDFYGGQDSRTQVRCR